MLSISVVLLILIQVIIMACAKNCEVIGTVPNPAPQPDVQAPESFKIIFYTNLPEEKYSPIVIQVNRTWAPLGADRIYSLVKDGFYNQAAFFRVVPDFVLQFGISALPSENSKWNTIIVDDPVIVSNSNWTVTYATAGPDTRTTQLFINYVNNARLDASGFTPFGQVISGFETALRVNNPTPGDSNGADQDLYTEKGNSWILQEYPDITLITCGEIV